MLIATAFLAACSNEDQRAEVPEGAVEISLASSLTAETTRGAFDDTNDASITRLQGSQIANGEKVYVWIDENTSPTATSYVEAWEITADGAGALTPAATDKKYYPGTGNNVNFYCIHGNFSATPSGAFPTMLTHQVALDQSTAANYAKSDLLYGSLQDCSRTTAARAILFKHKLAKIEVKLIIGTGVTLAQLTDAGTYVKLLGTNDQADYTPAKQDAYANITPAITLADYGGTLSNLTQSTTNTDITMYSQTDGSATDAIGEIPVFAEAVIIPQTVGTTNDFIHVHLSSGGDLYAKLSASTTFEAGKKYLYKVTVNLSGLQVSSSITDWDPVAGGNLDAKMNTP